MLQLSRSSVPALLLGAFGAIAWTAPPAEVLPEPFEEYSLEPSEVIVATPEHPAVEPNFHDVEVAPGTPGSASDGFTIVNRKPLNRLDSPR